MPVRHRDLGDELAPPQPKRCRHCDETRSSCGDSGDSAGSAGRESWRVTLDHDLVETLSAIYPEWFKPQHRRGGCAGSPGTPRALHTPSTPSSSASSTEASSASPPRTPASDDAFSWCTELDMGSRQVAGGSGMEPTGSPPRVSPPKVIVDDSPLQPAMGKHKESLKVKLMMRRPINQLVAQGIMPPLKTPPAYFEQCKQLERAKTGDLLKAKIQRRPDRQELERRHILEKESHVDPSLAEKQRMLKKARLADQLNDQLSHRPGPLELIKKNILHTEEDIETAVKSGTLAFKATSEGASARPTHPSSYCGPPDDASPTPSPPSTLSPASAISIVSVTSPPQHPAPGKDKNKKKNKHKQQQQRLKFHEYKGPPNSRHNASPADSAEVETPYELLLQQQQLLLQLMVPASPAASIASDSSEYSAPPPPPPPPPCVTTHHHLAPLPSRFEDMKVSDLRAECKRRNLRVSGPKPQLLDRLRPYVTVAERCEETQRSPASVASPEPAPAPAPEVSANEDIVQSQRRHIEELERKLDASRQQLEAVRREAAGAAASDQSRRLLQAHLCVSQLRAQLDALQQPPAPPAPPPPAAPPAARYVLASTEPSPDRLVRLFTVSSPSAASADGSVDVHKASATPTYIFNGVKVVPIAILPTHYEPERAAPVPPPPPPPPLPQLQEYKQEVLLKQEEYNPEEYKPEEYKPEEYKPEVYKQEEYKQEYSQPDSEDSQIMDDVLEILVENGELPASAVGSSAPQSIDTDYMPSSVDTFSPAEVLGEGHNRETLAADDLQRELNDIQNEILNGADMQSNVSHNIDPELDFLSKDFHPEFSADASIDEHDFFGRLLAGVTERSDDAQHMAMDIGEDPPERMSITPLPNGDLLEHSQPGFDDMDDLTLPSFNNEESRHGVCDFDLKEFGIETNMNVDNDNYEYMETQLIPNLFGRGHMPQRDPLMGGVIAPAPRPAAKHYSWDKIEFDAT